VHWGPIRQAETHNLDGGTDMAKGNGQRRATRYAALPYRYHSGWRIQWIDMNGKRRSKAFANGKYAKPYDEALAELTRIKGEIQAIKDGRLPKPTKVPTFTEFVDRYWITRGGQL
jgi:hypothetical protein